MPAKKPVNHQEQIVHALFAAARAKGWETVTLADVVRLSKLKPAVVETALGEDRAQWLGFIEGYISDRMLSDLKGTEFSGDQPVHERLFEVMMARFDVMQDVRDDLIPVLKGAVKDSCQGVQLLALLPDAMNKVAARAGIGFEGNWLGRAKILGLCALYLRVLKVWMDDDSPDLSKTMAALDQSLTYADRAMEWVAAA